MSILETRKLCGIKLVAVALIVIMITLLATTVAQADTVDTQAAPTQLSESGSASDSASNGAKSNPTSEYREERIEEVPYKTLYQYSSDLARGEMILGTPGELGTKKVIGKVIIQNGKIVERKEVSTTIINAAVDEVFLIGSLWDLPDMNYTFEKDSPITDVSYDSSLYENLPDESKGSKGGREIIEYAMQYLGTPYVWGGTSLTGGCDCSGFVYSVFNACGYNVPRNGMEYVYPISMDELKPGDVISYPDHYTIYIGNGMEIGALNWRYGVCITPVGYVSGYYNAVRIAEDK